MDKYFFPSGHTTRAAMVSQFILNHLELTNCGGTVGFLPEPLSRNILRQYNISNVALGFFWAT